MPPYNTACLLIQMIEDFVNTDVVALHIQISRGLFGLQVQMLRGLVPIYVQMIEAFIIYTDEVSRPLVSIFRLDRLAPCGLLPPQSVDGSVVAVGWMRACSHPDVSRALLTLSNIPYCVLCAPAKLCGNGYCVHSSFCTVTDLI